MTAVIVCVRGWFASASAFAAASAPTAYSASTASSAAAGAGSAFATMQLSQKKIIRAAQLLLAVLELS